MPDVGFSEAALFDTSQQIGMLSMGKEFLWSNISAWLLKRDVARNVTSQTIALWRSKTVVCSLQG